MCDESYRFFPHFSTANFSSHARGKWLPYQIQKNLGTVYFKVVKGFDSKVLSSDDPHIGGKHENGFASFNSDFIAISVTAADHSKPVPVVIFFE